MRWRRCGSPFQRNAVFNRRTWPLVHLTICSLRIRWSQRITPPVPKTIHSDIPRPPPKTSRFNKLWKRYDIVSIKETLESAPTAGDALFSHDGENLLEGQIRLFGKSEPRSSPSALPMAKHSRRSVSAPRFLSH